MTKSLSTIETLADRRRIVNDRTIEQKVGF